MTRCAYCKDLMKLYDRNEQEGWTRIHFACGKKIKKLQELQKLYDQE